MARNQSLNMAKSENKIETDNPTSLSLLFTIKCNLNCAYCFINKDKGENLSLDLSTAKKSVDILFSYPGVRKTLYFSGGEPMLEFALLKKIHTYAKCEAKKKGILLDTVVVTNGTLLNREMIRFFFKEKIKVKISLDGGKIIHDKNRPFKNNPAGSSFEQVIKNISRIDLIKMRAAVTLVFTPKTMDHLLENIKFLQTKNFFSIEFFPDIYAPWKSSDLVKFRRIMKNFGGYYRSFFDQDYRVDVFRNSLLEMLVNNVSPMNKNACGKINVGTDGEIYVCDKVFSLPPNEREAYVIGNAQTGLQNELRKEKINALRQDFYAASGLPCLGCKYAKYCFCLIGHHLYFSHQKLGKNNKKLIEPFCSFSKAYLDEFSDIAKKMRKNSIFSRLYKN